MKIGPSWREDVKLIFASAKVPLGEAWRRLTCLRKSVEKSHDVRARYRREPEKTREEPLYDPLTSPVKCVSYGMGSCERYKQHKISSDDARLMKLWVV